MGRRLLLLGGGGGGAGPALGRRLGKPFLLVDLSCEPDAAAVVDWLKAAEVAVLNVAGPRASGAPGVHGKAAAFLREVFGLMLGAG